MWFKRHSQMQYNPCRQATGSYRGTNNRLLYNKDWTVMSCCLEVKEVQRNVFGNFLAYGASLHHIPDTANVP